MEAAWLSRDHGIIKYADMGSRDFHKDDITVDFETFATIVNQFGDFDVDCFSSAHNTKGKVFFSWLDVPGSSGMDFFLQRCVICLHPKLPTHTSRMVHSLREEINFI